MTFHATLEISTSFSLAQSVILDGVGPAVRTACVEGAAEAIRVHTYKDRTGTLTRSITGELTFASRGKAEGEIVAATPYAKYVEEGTRPHDIWPKAGYGERGPLKPGQGRRKLTDVGTHRVMLRWYDDAGGVHFARMVHHPGSKPYPFMGPAYLKAERVLEREVDLLAARAESALARA